MRFKSSDWKKVKDGNDHTILQDSKGHQLKVLHKPLSPGMIKKIKALSSFSTEKMADGGEVSDNDIIADKKQTDDYNAVHEDTPKEYSQNVTSRMQKTDVTPKQRMPMFAEGELVDTDNLPHVTPEGQILNQDGLPQGGNDQFNMGSMAPGINPVAGLPDTIDSNQVPQSAQPSATPVAAPNSIERAPAAISPSAENTPLDAQEGTATPSGVLEGTPDLMSGYQQQMKGLGQEAAATSALGKQEAQIAQRQVESKAEALKNYQGEVSKLETERQHAMQDVKDGYINPEHYWENHSKIATGLGLILAGFNPTNSPNAALEFLKNNIERDTKAQEANLGAKNNLLAHTMQQFGNVRDAATFANVLKSDQMAAELQTAAAKSKDPMAQARLNQLAGQLTQQFYPQYLNLSMKQAMIKAAQQPGGGGIEHMLPIMRVMAPEQAKEIEGRYVPGVGMANIPVPQSARDNIIAKQQLGQMAKGFYDWSAKHSGNLDPAIVNEGKTKAAELQSLYRNAINGGVFKKGEQEFIDHIVDSDPTKFFNSIRVLPKLKEILRSNDQQLNTLKQNYELPTSQESTLPQTKSHNGVTLYRGPNGKAVTADGKLYEPGKR